MSAKTLKNIKISVNKRRKTAIFLKRIIKIIIPYYLRRVKGREIM